MLAARRQASLEGCTQDAMHAINQQREQRPADRLLIVGSSWGGAVAVDCVAKGVQPDAMLLLAPALAASGFYGLFWPRASLPNTLFDAMRDQSVVCLHGTDDDVVRVSEGRCRDHRRGVPTLPPLLTKTHPPTAPSSAPSTTGASPLLSRAGRKVSPRRPPRRNCRGRPPPERGAANWPGSGRVAGRGSHRGG